QRVPRRPALARGGRQLGAAGRDGPRRRARPVPDREHGPAVPVVLVGRRPGRPRGVVRMHAQLPREVARPPEVKPVVEFHEVSKWYGNVIGINKLSIRVPAGVTGLLGPNGAGKSTLLQLATGQLRPSQGDVRVLGQKVWNNPALNRSIGLCPEQDAFYEWMTGRDFVHTSARLGGLSHRDAKDATARTIDSVGMT